MKVLQKMMYYLFISIMCILLFSGCSDKRINQSLQNNVNLNTWLGDYEFFEHYPPNIDMEYYINIYNENNDYYAKISIDGFQTTSRIKAKVLSKQDGIDLVFESYLPDNDFELYKKGDVLLNFRKENSGIYTYWGKIEAILPENKTSGKVYFTKVKE